MKNDILRVIIRNALVAGIYFILTFVTSSISFLGIQVRIAEALVLLCFFRRDYTYGVTIGCIIVNIFSPMGLWDVLFGSLATFISCLIVSFCKHLFIATLFPVAINAFVVGAELYFILSEPFWFNVGMVAAGEALAVTLIGYMLFLILGKRDAFKSIIKAQRNLNFKW